MALSIPRAAARRHALVWACALILLATGCDPRVITIRILDFDSSEVAGIGIWRQVDETGDWELVSEIDVSVQYVPAQAGEVAYYDFELADGSSIPSTAAVMRDDSTPGDVILTLYWNRITAPGMFRVSTFNAAGHSALSFQAVPL